MKTHAPRRNTGFTLAELLVVVTIIIILTGIAFPVFSKLRVRAIWTKTAPQMQAALNGFHDYATEHNGFYPPAYFPQGGDKDTATGDNLEGDAGWLDQTIFAQVYADANAKVGEESGAQTDAGDNTTGVKGTRLGQHLQKTVFEVLASIHLNPNERNWYNHSYCLNRKLITDAVRAQQSKPEFTPRQRALFPDDAATMLLVEGTQGDHNSVGPESFAQILDAAKRYEGKFVHVGYMDGHVERVLIKRFPKSHSGTDENSYFWTGVNMQAYTAFEKANGGSQRVNY